MNLFQEKNPPRKRIYRTIHFLFRICGEFFFCCHFCIVDAESIIDRANHSTMFSHVGQFNHYPLSHIPRLCFITDNTRVLCVSEIQLEQSQTRAKSLLGRYNVILFCECCVHRFPFALLRAPKTRRQDREGEWGNGGKELRQQK